MRSKPSALCITAFRIITYLIWQGYLFNDILGQKYQSADRLDPSASSKKRKSSLYPFGKRRDLHSSGFVASVYSVVFLPHRLDLSTSLLRRGKLLFIRLETAEIILADS